MRYVVARRGYAGASIARVIERAGVSRATFHEHFGCRDECFVAACSEVVALVQRRLCSAAKNGTSGSAPETVLTELLHLAAADSAAARLILIEALGGSAAVRTVREPLIASIECTIDDLLHEHSTGVGPLQIPAAALLGGVAGILSTHLLEGNGWSLPRIRSQLLAWIDSYALTAGGERWAQSAWDAMGGDLAPAHCDGPDRDPTLLPRGRNSLSASRVAAVQRDRILTATCELSVTKGFVALTVADIVDVARVPRGVFYTHFRNKEDAFSAAQTAALQGSIGAAAAEFFVGESWPDRVWRAGAALLEYMARNPDLTYLGMIESYAVGEAAIRRQQDTRSAFAVFLEEGYRMTEWTERLPRLTSDAIGWAVFALVRREVVAGRTTELPWILPEVAYVITAPFIGPETAMKFVGERAPGDAPVP
jgi:AcrR family transcriptional regulator